MAGSPDKEKTINPEQASAIAPYSKALYRRAKSSEPVHITTTILLLLNMTLVAMLTNRWDDSKPPIIKIDK